MADESSPKAPPPSPPDAADTAPLWECAALTDVGKVRDHNEDYFIVRPDLGLFIVCDGMGGHSAGEVASELAAQTASEFFERCRRDPDGTWPFRIDTALGEEGSRLPVALRHANEKIREVASKDAKKANMGTTAVAAFLHEDRSYVAHAGDSRGYLFRGGKIGRSRLITPCSATSSARSTPRRKRLRRSRTRTSSAEPSGRRPT